MGLMAWLGFPEATSGRVEAASTLTQVMSVSPSAHASLLSLAGITSDTEDYVTRQQALGVPALSNGVTLMLAIVQQLPLAAENAPDATARFLAELDPTVTPGWTKARTVEDLIWYGQAWWRVTKRDAATKFPRNAEWIAAHRVLVDTEAQKVTIDGEEQNPDDLRRFDGVVDGLLNSSERARAIATAVANVKASKTFAQHPMPAAMLKDREGQEVLDATDAARFLDDLDDAIAGRGRGYMGGLTLETFGWNARELQLVEARQQDAVEMARLLCIHPRYVAAPTQGSDLTYQNLGEVRRDLIETGGLSTYLVPIEQRLSMPDTTPRNTVVKFAADSFFNRVTEGQPAPSDPNRPTDPGATL